MRQGRIFSDTDKKRTSASAFNHSSRASQLPYFQDNRQQFRLAALQASPATRSIQGVSSNTTQFVIQRDDEDEAGLVPPTTHGRTYKAPAEPVKATKGHRHILKRDRLTRSERMIDRIGRILTQKVNVHVAVALDGNTLVISANKEDDARGKKGAIREAHLDTVIKALKDNLDAYLKRETASIKDPLSEKSAKTDKARRTKDLQKISALAKGHYEDEEVEVNEFERSQLAKIKKALIKGEINKETYHKGGEGVYIIKTEFNGDNYNVHGEQKVTNAIKTRREAAAKSDEDLFKGQHIYVGGMLSDCYACNAAHKVINDQVAKFKWAFYTGGTHGYIFPRYKKPTHLSEEGSTGSYEKLAGATFSKGELSSHNLPPQPTPMHQTTPDDSDSETEDIPIVIDLQKKLRDASGQLRQATRVVTKLQEEQEAAKAPSSEKASEQVATVKRSLAAISKELEAAIAAQKEKSAALQKLRTEVRENRKRMDFLNQEPAFLKEQEGPEDSD